MNRSCSVCSILSLAFLVGTCFGATIYVDDDATGSNDGTSWANAYNSLQTAIGVAAEYDTILVAQGDYVPTTTFTITKSISLYGGYCGSADPGARDVQAYETTLRGGATGSQPIVTFANYMSDKSLVLDGFRLAGGGGGLYVNQSQRASVTVRDCIFRYSVASPTLGNAGGAIFLRGWYASMDVTRCSFVGNTAYSGGAIWNDRGVTTRLTDCWFEQNSATTGAAIRCEAQGTVALTNCALLNNVAADYYGGGGAVFSRGGRVLMTNCTLRQNASSNWHAVALQYDSVGPVIPSSAFIDNCILWDGGNELYVEPDHGSTATVSYSNIQGGWVGTGNINLDPGFVSATDLRLSTGSPCIDAGNDAVVSTSTDLAGNPRISGAHVDMGAYESSAAVDSDGDGVPDTQDAFPNNPNEWADTDGDGVGDNSDAFPNDPAEWADSDGDGVGNNNDVFPNDSGEWADSDGDGVGDNSDAFPNNPSEWLDSDGDGVGNNSDAFPNDPLEWADTDGDGAGDNSDAFPNDPSEWLDTDGDGVGNNSDAFPNDPLEWADTDGDGVGNNSDVFPNDSGEWADNDGDGVGNNSDAFPNNPLEWADTDGDGVGNNSDVFPNDATEWADSDGDGVGNNGDAFPNDPTEWLDSDADGHGDNSDLFPNDPTRWRDDQGPVVSDVVASPNPVAVAGSVVVTAYVDDSTACGSDVSAAVLTLKGGGEAMDLPMISADDGFDEVAEEVIVGFTAPASAGVYDLSIRGTDAAGNTGDATSIMFVVYDPSAGFVTGGGWIQSPVGAYVPDPTWVGKANFGFVSKYQKGANVPSGNTEFQFKTGNLNFRSTSYEWLVVNQNGSNAQFKGSGTINGSGVYKFMLWAGDGAPDTFRIKIWSEGQYGAEVVAYDNGFNQAVGGGSIAIHTK
jgi:hypothetical protein